LETGVILEAGAILEAGVIIETGVILEIIRYLCKKWFKQLLDAQYRVVKWPVSFQNKIASSD
jgi:tetrahydrodipicolinate N-succinyltransferase